MLAFLVARRGIITGIALRRPSHRCSVSSVGKEGLELSTAKTLAGQLLQGFRLVAHSMLVKAREHQLKYMRYSAKTLPVSTLLQVRSRYSCIVPMFFLILVLVFPVLLKLLLLFVVHLLNV